MSDTKRTMASRPRHAWLLSLWIFPSSAFLAALIASDWGGGVSEISVWLARVVVAAGGLLTGLLTSRQTSGRAVIAALLMPMPSLAVFGFLMAGLSNSASDLPEVGRILVLAFLLFDVPLVLAFKARADLFARRSEGVAPGQ